MVYNKSQWMESFEGQLAILRPHLTARVLTTISLAAWGQFGVSGEDPIKVAREWSKAMDQAAAGRK
jgi:hypothetical protein